LPLPEQAIDFIFEHPEAFANGGFQAFAVKDLDAAPYIGSIPHLAAARAATVTVSRRPPNIFEMNSWIISNSSDLTRSWHKSSQRHSSHSYGATCELYHSSIRSCVASEKQGNADHPSFPARLASATEPSSIM
jgi:hypothetical protein